MATDVWVDLDAADVGFHRQMGTEIYKCLVLLNEKCAYVFHFALVHHDVSTEHPLLT